MQLAGLAGEELPGFECNVGVAGPGVAANIHPDVLGGFLTVIEGQAGAVGDVAAGGGQQVTMVAVRVLVGDLVDGDELATVAGPALVVDHGVVDVVHDHGRDGPLGTAHIDLLVVGARHGGEGGKLVRQVAANNGRHAAAVGESAGVDAVPVDEVVVVNIGDNVFHEGEVFAWPTCGVWCRLPSPIERFRVNDNSVIPGAGVLVGGGFHKGVHRLVPPMEAKEHRNGVGFVGVIVGAHMHDVAALGPILGGERDALGITGRYRGVGIRSVVVLNGGFRWFRRLRRGVRCSVTVRNGSDLWGGGALEELPQRFGGFRVGNA